MLIFETTKDLRQIMGKLKIIREGFYIINIIMYLCRLLIRTTL